VNSKNRQSGGDLSVIARRKALRHNSNHNVEYRRYLMLFSVNFARDAARAHIKHRVRYDDDDFDPTTLTNIVVSDNFGLNLAPERISLVPVLSEA
jgi:hypothetical protein